MHLVRGLVKLASGSVRLDSAGLQVLKQISSDMFHSVLSSKFIDALKSHIPSGYRDEMCGLLHRLLEVMKGAVEEKVVLYEGFSFLLNRLSIDSLVSKAISDTTGLNPPLPPASSWLHSVICLSNSDKIASGEDIQSMVRSMLMSTFGSLNLPLLTEEWLSSFVDLVPTLLNFDLNEKVGFVLLALYRILFVIVSPINRFHPLPSIFFSLTSCSSLLVVSL